MIIDGAKQNIEEEVTWLEFIQDEVDMEDTIEGTGNYLRNVGALKKVKKQKKLFFI